MYTALFHICYSLHVVCSTYIYSCTCPSICCVYIQVASVASAECTSCWLIKVTPTKSTAAVVCAKQGVGKEPFKEKFHSNLECAVCSVLSQLQKLVLGSIHVQQDTERQAFTEEVYHVICTCKSFPHPGSLSYCPVSWLHQNVVLEILICHLVSHGVKGQTLPFLDTAPWPACGQDSIHKQQRMCIPSRLIYCSDAIHEQTCAPHYPRYRWPELSNY